MTDRCSSCILPTSIPALTLDQDGKCNYCRKFESKLADKEDSSNGQTKERFEAIIERMRGKGKYDCLVPLSGGKESCYILYILVKEYNLKPLAFNFSNGFQHDDAVHNIENIVDQLGIDLVIYRPNGQLMRELMRAFLSKAGEFCTPCNMLINATAFRLARQNAIKLIMSGNTSQTGPGLEGVSPALYYDRRYYLNVANDLIRRRERGYYLVPSYASTAIRRLLGIAPRVINVLDYLKPSLQQIHDTLESIGWKRPAGAIQHGDCLLDPLKDFLMCRKWGCSELTAVYSVLVRNREITRDEALRRALAEEHLEAPTVLSDLLKAIGMTEREFSETSKRDFREISNLRSNPFFQWARKLVHKVEQLRRGR